MSKIWVGGIFAGILQAGCSSWSVIWTSNETQSTKPTGKYYPVASSFLNIFHYQTPEGSGIASGMLAMQYHFTRFLTANLVEYFDCRQESISELFTSYFIDMFC